MSSLDILSPQANLSILSFSQRENYWKLGSADKDRKDRLLKWYNLP